MKALTISQPYADLIAHGEKWIENRTWPTRYRGPLAIHAGKGKQYLTAEQLKCYPSGCVVAVAKLVTTVTINEIKKFGVSHPDDLICEATERTFGQALQHKHAEGPWCWILEDVVMLVHPYVINGRQGLWEFDGELLK